MVSWISVGSIRRSSFTVSPGPGDLLLLRSLIHLLNALLSSMEERSQFLSLVLSDSSCVIMVLFRLHREMHRALSLLPRRTQQLRETGETVEN